jgi:hypothetical protein
MLVNIGVIDCEAKPDNTAMTGATPDGKTVSEQESTA